MLIREVGGAVSVAAATTTENRIETQTTAIVSSAQNPGPERASRTGEQNFSASLVRFNLFAVAGNKGAAKPDVQKSLDAVFEAYGMGYAQGGARELARQLRQGDAAFRAELMGRLTEGNSPAAIRILRAAGSEPVPYGGSERVSAADGQIIARALGEGYDRGKLGGDFARQWVRAEADFINRPGSFGDWPYNEYTGNLIAQSGSAKLMRDYATAAINHAARAETSNDLQMLNGAARAMAGDSGVLTEILGKLDRKQFAGGDIDLERFLGTINTPKELIGEDPSRAVRGESPLAALLNGAAYMPRGALELKLFSTIASNSRFTEGRGVADALVRLYQSDSRFLTDKLIDTSETLDGVVTLSQFFQHTLYNADCTQKESLMGTAARLAEQYKAENRPNQLGIFAGTIANGLQLAVKDEDKRKEAVKDFVGLIFEVVPVGGKLKDIFGKALGGAVGEHIGKLVAEKGVDSAQKAISDFLVDRLTKETGLFGWGNGAKLRDRNDVDEILRGAFDVKSLRDTNPITPENDGLQYYNNGLGTAYDALEGSGLL